MLDYHIHTKLCKHADGEPKEYILNAVAKGLDEIGFADHCPFPSGFDTRFRMSEEQFEQYKKIVFDAQNKFKNIAIKYGLEVDWVSGRMDEVFAKIANEPFDYLIGSIHYTDNFPFDNPEIEEVWREDKSLAEKVWKSYLEISVEMVSSGKLNIIGHFDIPKKFGYYPPNMEKFFPQIREIFEIAAKNQMAIEINSSGLKKPIKEIYPSLKILRLAKEAGLHITFGSDAHSPKDVAADFNLSIKLAKFAGYTTYAAFDKKTIKLRSLSD